MRARYAVAETAGSLNTQDGVHGCVGHIQDMMRLRRGDNMGLRDMIPALMLRLDRDQECYDFIKWWCTAGSQSTYDWGDMDAPYLDIKGVHALEHVHV